MLLLEFWLKTDLVVSPPGCLEDVLEDVLVDIWGLDFFAAAGLGHGSLPMNVLHDLGKSWVWLKHLWFKDPPFVIFPEISAGRPFLAGGPSLVQGTECSFAASTHGVSSRVWGWCGGWRGRLPLFAGSSWSLGDWPVRLFKQVVWDAC